MIKKVNTKKGKMLLYKLLIFLVEPGKDLTRAGGNGILALEEQECQQSQNMSAK